MKLPTIILFLCVAVSTSAQTPALPRETAILIGVDYGLNQVPFKLGTITLERSLLHHMSMQWGIGLNCLHRPKNPTYQKLDTQLYSELRYYAFLRRGHALTGFYFGAFGSWNRERWLYRAGKHIAIRRSFADFGLTAGYQHEIGKYLRFNEGIAAGHHAGTYETHFQPNGGIDAADHHYSSWFAAQAYFRIGVVF